MPLVKKAAQPAPAAEASATKAVEVAATLTAQASAPAVQKSADLQPKDLDRKSREIQRQGAFQAALQSVGVVQHGGKSFQDYLARVREAANAELVYINEK